MRHLAGSFCSLGLGLSALCHAVMADSQPQSVDSDAVVFRTSQDAEHHFAVAIKSLRASATVKRHVVIVDTSASQTGKFRDGSLQVLRSLASAFPQDHEILVAAVDSTFEQLTTGFVAPNSVAYGDAVQKLSDRTPMGATDLASSLKQAVSLVDADAPASLLYIGDGITPSTPLNQNHFSLLVKNMQSA